MKSNTKRIFIATLLIAVVVFGISYYINKISNEVIVAKINGENILKSEIEGKLHSVFEGQGFGKSSSEIQTPEISNLPKEVIKIIVREVYLDKEIAKKAKKAGLTKVRNIKQRIIEAQNKIIRQSYIDSMIKSGITEEIINEKYIELRNELSGKKEYLLHHIVVKNEKEAKRVYKSLKKGSSFEKLSKSKSVDKESGSNGGKLGYILEDNMIEEISKKVVDLDKNQISKPIKTKFGFHIVKFTDTREAKALPFEAVKNNIRQQLIQDQINALSDDLVKDAKIEILIETNIEVPELEKESIDQEDQKKRTI